MTDSKVNALYRSIQKTTSDTWIGVTMLIVAMVYWLEANKIAVSPLDDQVGASGLPKVLAYVLAGLALLLIYRGIHVAKARVSDTEVSAVKSQSLTAWFKPHLRAVGMLVIGVLYLLVLPFLGYIISIALLLLTVSLYNGASFNVRTILVAVIGAVLCQLLFVHFLGIDLPPGKLIAMMIGS